jgi:hypothetical protein
MAIQASRSLKGAGSDQTILGCRKPSIFPVANPPCRLSGKLSNIVSFVLGFEGRAFRHHPLLDKAPQGDGQVACESNDANLAAAMVSGIFDKDAVAKPSDVHEAWANIVDQMLFSSL